MAGKAKAKGTGGLHAHPGKNGGMESGDVAAALAGLTNLLTGADGSQGVMEQLRLISAGQTQQGLKLEAVSHEQAAQKANMDSFKASTEVSLSEIRTQMQLGPQAALGVRTSETTWNLIRGGALLAFGAVASRFLPASTPAPAPPTPPPYYYSAPQPPPPYPYPAPQGYPSPPQGHDQSQAPAR